MMWQEYRDIQPPAETDDEAEDERITVDSSCQVKALLLQVKAWGCWNEIDEMLDACAGLPENEERIYFHLFGLTHPGNRAPSTSDKVHYINALNTIHQNRKRAFCVVQAALLLNMMPGFDIGAELDSALRTSNSTSDTSRTPQDQFSMVKAKADYLIQMTRDAINAQGVAPPNEITCQQAAEAVAARPANSPSSISTSVLNAPQSQCLPQSSAQDKDFHGLSFAYGTFACGGALSVIWAVLWLTGCVRCGSPPETDDFQDRIADRDFPSGENYDAIIKNAKFVPPRTTATKRAMTRKFTSLESGFTSSGPEISGVRGDLENRLGRGIGQPTGRGHPEPTASDGWGPRWSDEILD